MAVKAALLCVAAVAMAEGKTKFECEDFTEDSNPECFENITWAMQTGMTTNSSWYPAATTTFSDFQCALFMKKGYVEGPSHNCFLPPCTLPSAEMTSKGGADYLKSVDEFCEPPKEASFPWWGWVLVAIGVLSLAAIGALVAMQMKKAPKKKKRALKPVEPPAPAPVETKAEPLPQYQMVYTAPPVYAAPQPVMTTMAPQVYAAPQPVMTTMAPQVYAAQQPVMTAAPVATMSMAAPMAMPAYASQAYATPSSFVIQQ